MANFRKIKASLVKSEFEDHIGELGQLFFNIETGELRLGNDITPGGLSIGGSSGGTVLTVSETGNNGILSNEVTRVTAIRFDRDTGFNVESLGAGEVKVSLGSTFKTWKVDGQQDLVAVGEDTIRIIPGAGLTITTNPDAEIKNIRFDLNLGENLTVDENGVISVDQSLIAENILGASTNIENLQSGDALLYQAGQWINSPGMYWSSKNW